MKPTLIRMGVAASLFAFAAGAGLVSAPQVTGTAAASRLEGLVRDIVREADGTFGVAVEHLESGAGFSVNGDGLFPMASVVKLPILTEVMFQVRDGKFGFSDAWEVLPADQFYDGSLLSDLNAPGIRLTVENLINMMMWLSDNTATDLLLAKVGIAAVNARMRAIGIEAVTLGRTIRQILLDYYMGESAPYMKMGREEFEAVYAKRLRENPERAAKTRRDFGSKPSDQASPRAINALLGKIFRQEILDGPACDRILEVMARCQTGPGRIRGLLPPGTAVAHKTGTIGGTLNDCGIIELPGGRGHVALSVLSRDADPDHAESVIALIAKTVYDAFYFGEPGQTPRS